MERTMRILVTGGAGFIGTHLCRRLKADGHDVTVLDLKQGSLTGIRYLKGDVRNRDHVVAAMEGQEAAVHLAAQVSAPRSIEEPSMTAETNVGGSRNLLEAAAATGAKVVLASTAAVYGESPPTPTTEETPIAPMTPYASSKAEMEAAAEASPAKSCCLRIFNVYGPGQDPSSRYAAAIPSFIAKARQGERITLHGDGEQTRDFIYVEDLCDAILLAIEKGEGIINIASGKAVTIKEVAQLIVKLTASKSAIVHGPRRDGDPRRSLADVTKAKERLGFIASTSFEEGVERTIETTGQR